MKIRTSRSMFAAANALPLGDHASVELFAGAAAMSGSFVGLRG